MTKTKALLDLAVISPDWPAPANVRAMQTTRQGGVSLPPYSSFNLAMHVQDAPAAVQENRQCLRSVLPSEPVWLNQVHGTTVLDASQVCGVLDADATFTTMSNVVCVSMTADCLPVLLCDKAGTVVAAVHAGWRGLCDGVVEAAVAKMPVAPSELLAWLGPAIGPNAFEVGDDVRAQFIQRDAQAALAFKPHADKWLANLYVLAQQRLNTLGIKHLYGAGISQDFCSYTDAQRFFSYRREPVTGRMASLIWLEA
ncbi:MAG: peptidoglycan editing factor PgeF [Methylotenera sp.]|nr:peptidoglycan editing factor PgeF [Methylotenera sp.]